MKKDLRQLAKVASLCVVTALFSACGGDDNGGGTGSLYTGKTTQATITADSVKKTLEGIHEIIPSCNATGVAKFSTNQVQSTVVKTLNLIVLPAGSKGVGTTKSLLPVTKPADKVGSCGGKLSYPTYSHSSGTTTMTVKWDQYCNLDSDTGNKTTYNGELSAVDTGTPNPSGPVTTKLTANVPKLTVVETDPTGKTIKNQVIALSGFEYVPAKGSGSTQKDLAGTATFTSFEYVDAKNNKQYKLENVDLTVGNSGTEDKTLSIKKARIYRSTSGYSDVKTDPQIVIDSKDNLKSGAIIFTGANNSTAKLTADPTQGAGQNFTVSVNGEPLAGVGLSCKVGDSEDDED